MSPSRRVFAILLYCLLLQLSATKRNYDIKMSMFTCTLLEPKSANFLECILYKDGRYPVITTKFSVARQFDHFDAHILIDILRKDNSVANFVDLKFDGCKYLGAASLTNFMSVTQKRIMKVSNLPKKCPIRANQTYSINNFTTYPDDLPANLPFINWRFTLKLSQKQQRLADVEMRGSLVRRV